MHLNSLNLNNSQKTKQKDAIFFKGDPGKIANPDAIKKLSAVYLDGTYDFLTKHVPANFIKNTPDGLEFTKASPIIDTLLFPFVKLPKEILIQIRDRFNIEALKSSKILITYETEKKNEAYQRALRGLLQNADACITNYSKETNTPLDKIAQDALNFPKDNNTDFSKLYDKLADSIYTSYDENFLKYRSKYHTPHERAVVRLVSGITAATMLGNDFYNKSIMNGKDEETAKKELKDKREQEIIATAEEAVSQYFLLGAFSNFSNNSKWGAPILNTILGMIFHVTSRLSKKKPLTRIKLPNNIKYNTPDIQTFRESAKNNQALTLNIQETNKNTPIKKEKHLLCAKNILLVCLLSITAGFSAKGISNTKTFNRLKDGLLDLKPVKTLLKKYHDSTIGEVWATKEELETFFSRLRTCKKEEMAAFYNNKILSGPQPPNRQVIVNPDGNKIEKLLLGEYEKMIKIPFTNIEMSKKELLRVPLVPFKIIFELVSYPYKAAAKIYEGISNSYKSKHNPKIIPDIAKGKEKESPIKNPYCFVNTYRDYLEQLKLHQGLSEEEFIGLYKERINDNLVTALNKETKSSVDNAAIGKMTQLLSLFGSLYFASTDDYNRTLKQTGDVEKASKDARLRAVNKMIRTVTQSVFLGINQLFKIPYATSILNAGIITAICTVITDTFSRVLSGMPSKRMNKEQLENYNKNMKQGPLKGYYKVLDKLID